jgi:hypothetical protein
METGRRCNASPKEVGYAKLPQVDHAPFCSKEFDCLPRGGGALYQLKIVTHVSGIADGGWV